MAVSSRLRDPVRTAPLIGVGLVAAGAALWGVDGALRTPLVSPTPRWSPWTIVLYEHVILVAVVLPFLLRHRGELRRLTPAGWLSALGIGWGASALATLAFTDAFNYGNPTVIVLLQKTQPLWAITAAALVVGELPRARFGLFVVPALLGTYLLSFGGMSPGDAFTGAAGKAALLALAAAALWGTATALGRRALDEVGPDVLTALRFTLALPLLLVIALWESAVAPPAAAVGADWVRLPLIALLPGLVAMVLYYHGLERTPAPVATLAELAFPATAVVVNYLYLDVGVRASQIAGFAVIWLTIAVLHRAPVRVPAEREPFGAQAVAAGR